MVIASNDYVPLYTGCALQYPLDGTITNSFDATRTVDNALCSTSDGPIENQWILRYPTTLQGGSIYPSSLVLGRNSSFLLLPPNCRPARSGVDVHWRVDFALPNELRRVCLHAPRFFVLNATVLNCTFKTSRREAQSLSSAGLLHG